MTNSQRDIWAEWLLKRRFGGDEEQFRLTMAFLLPIRDAVLEKAALQPGETLLDVGCGDGLIAFGALEKTPDCRVIFSDISQDLLDHTRGLAENAGPAILERCTFLRLSADALQEIPSESVDAVTTRSVLIYVDAKREAFAEFFRVLKPGGRLSIFEPINRFGPPRVDGHLWGYDVMPVRDLAAKVRAVYDALQPPDSDPMLNFDERDLLALVSEAGFHEVSLRLEASIRPRDPIPWDRWITFAPNPRVPTLGEAMDQVLTPDQREQLSAHLRPLVESATQRPKAWSALAYLWATR